MWSVLPLIEVSKKDVRKKRLKLIRYLTSWVPAFFWEFFIPETPRMYISPSLVQEIWGIPQIYSPSDDLNTSFSNFRPNFQNRQLQMYNSTPKKDKETENDKLKALQEQLDEIKQLVARLVDLQIEQCSGYGTLSSPSDQLQKSFIPPPPPPPPPPLPTTSFSCPSSTPLPKKDTNLKTKENQQGFPFGKDLLKELKAVQLKKIDKSPGGGPLKKPKTVAGDPGDFLAAALRKRFGTFRKSPESSFE